MVYDYAGGCAPVLLEDRGRHQVSYTVTLCLSPLRQGLSINLELGWQLGTAMILPPIPLALEVRTRL